MLFYFVTYLFVCLFCIFFYFVIKIDTLYTTIAPQQLPLYSSVCNASSSYSQNALCNNQRHVVYSTPSSTNCSNNCGFSNKMTCSNQYAHHSLIPHSKSLDHYNEATKFGEHYNASRHSFDNYKNSDCTDGIHVADQNNGCHYSSIVGNYQSNKYGLANTGHLYNVSGNRYPLPATLPFPDTSHHYSQIGNFDRGEHFIEPNHSSCCHQNSHYEYGRNSQLKSKKPD